MNPTVPKSIDYKPLHSYLVKSPFSPEASMERSTTTIVRKKHSLSNNSLATDSLNAILSIPVIRDARIENETEDEVTISYIYTGSDVFQFTQEYFSKFDVTKKEWIDKY